MRERPILFNDAMVRAILSGAKTQTRRPVKPQPDHIRRDAVLVDAGIIDNAFVAWTGNAAKILPSPFGDVGDRLWVRECFARVDPRRCSGISDHIVDLPPHSHVVYRATCEPFEWDGSEPEDRWTPSIHMPRWASRLTLGVLAVRVERLQDITETEARLEGFRENEEHPSATHAFVDAWPYEGEHGWQANPWVWVVSLGRVSDGGGR